HNANPTRQEVKKALTPNLCRCTGYKKIIDSILYAAEAFRENREIPKPQGSGKVGNSLPKYHADKLVLGQHRYVGDMSVEGMLHGALKFSSHPRARVLKIDISKAEQFPGVVKIFTADDIPGERHTGLIVNDWPLMIKTGEETRYIGDVLAGVVAETEDIARKAVEFIQVQYEVLEPVTNPHQAAKPDSPRIHPSGNHYQTRRCGKCYGRVRVCGTGNL
ncbi:MAG: 2Fe-2S iron-sulfur cluster-binding protein, partial [Calditrichia bacterium]